MSIFNLGKYATPLLNTQAQTSLYSMFSINSSKLKLSNLKLAFCPIKTPQTLRGG